MPMSARLNALSDSFNLKMKIWIDVNKTSHRKWGSGQHCGERQDSNLINWLPAK